MIDIAKRDIRPGDTFIFYFAGHGTFDWTGDEVPVNAEICLSSLRMRVPTSGDELLALSTPKPGENMSDDDLSALFLDETWQQVNKLFVIDCCYSGGFMGTTTMGDTGDLTRLLRAAVLAASREEDFSYAHYEEAVGGAVSNLGCALVRALESLSDRSEVTYQQLFDQTVLEGKAFEGKNGYVFDYDEGFGIQLPMAFAPQMQVSPDFEFTLAVPEPATPVLLGTGCIALLGCVCPRRRWVR